MEYTSYHSVRGISSDGEDGVAEGVYEEGDIGDGFLQLVDGGEHLLVDSELLLGVGQGVG